MDLRRGLRLELGLCPRCPRPQGCCQPSMSQRLRVRAPSARCGCSDCHHHGADSGLPSGRTEAFPGASGGLWERSRLCLPQLRQRRPALSFPSSLFQEVWGGGEARPSRGEAPGSSTCCALAAPTAMPGASPTSFQNVCPQDHPARRQHPRLRHRPGNWGRAMRTGLSKVKELARGWRLRFELGPAWPEAWVHSGQGRPPPQAATTLASFLFTSRLMNGFSCVDAYLSYCQHLGQCLAQGWCLTSFLNG